MTFASRINKLLVREIYLMTLLLVRVIYLVSVICSGNLSGDTVTCSSKLYGDTITYSSKFSGDTVTCLSKLSGDTLLVLVSCPVTLTTSCSSFSLSVDFLSLFCIINTLKKTFSFQYRVEANSWQDSSFSFSEREFPVTVVEYPSRCWSTLDSFLSSTLSSSASSV